MITFGTLHVKSKTCGMRGPVVETDEYPSAEACARAVLDKILSGRIS